MALASRRRTTRPAVKRTTRAGAARLDVACDAIRQQEVREQRRTKLERSRGANPTQVFAEHAFTLLMSSRAQAAMELPLRIALSRTPFEAWRHHHQFVLGFINDCETALQLIQRTVAAPPK